MVVSVLSQGVATALMGKTLAIFLTIFDTFIDAGVSDQGSTAVLRGEPLAIFLTMFDALVYLDVSAKGVVEFMSRPEQKQHFKIYLLNQWILILPWKRTPISEIHYLNKTLLYLFYWCCMIIRTLIYSISKNIYI